MIKFNGAILSVKLQGKGNELEMPFVSEEQFPDMFSLSSDLTS